METARMKMAARRQALLEKACGRPAGKTAAKATR
jgi:hypothetical protein